MPRTKGPSAASSRAALPCPPLLVSDAPPPHVTDPLVPSDGDTATALPEERLWDAADQFRANSGLKSQEYSAPVLGLIFLRFAEVRFAAQRAKLETASASARRGRRVDEPAAYHAEGILYLPAEARFDYLLNRPEAENIGAKVNAAMRDIEKHNPQLAGVLPKTYNLFTSTLLKELLKKVSEIPASLDYDAFRHILETSPAGVLWHLPGLAPRGKRGRSALQITLDNLASRRPCRLHGRPPAGTPLRRVGLKRSTT